MNFQQHQRLISRKAEHLRPDIEAGSTAEPPAVAPDMLHLAHSLDAAQQPAIERAPKLDQHHAFPLHTPVQLVQRIIGHQFAAVNNHHPVADRLDLLHDMRRKNHRLSLPQRLNERPDLRQLVGIKPRSRLIEDEYLRVVQHRLRQPHPLPIPLRQGADLLVLLAPEPCELDQLGNARHGLRQAVQPREKTKVLLDVQVFIERIVLRQVADIAAHIHRLPGRIKAADFHTTRGSRDVAADDLHGSSLTGPVGPQKPQHLAGLRRKADVVHRFLRAI